MATGAIRNRQPRWEQIAFGMTIVVSSPPWTAQKMLAMLADERIIEIDLNPVNVYPNGEGALALDALIVTS